MPTIISSQFKGPSNTNDGSVIAVAIESHPNDSRVKICDEGVCQTMNSRMGTGGGNEPMVMTQKRTFIKVSHACGKDGEGERWEEGEVVGTRNVFDNGEARAQEVVCYENHQQDSRCKEVEACPALASNNRDALVGKTALVQQCIEEPNANPTFSVDQGGGKSSCLVNKELAPTIATTHQGEPVVNYHYAVRRITPIEGERLQGFVDNWTRPCFTEDMITDELCDRFIEIHAKWNAINGKPDTKRKTREQIKKWLLDISGDDCPDGPRYKAIGNSMSVNVMEWIGMRIEIADRTTYKGDNELPMYA